MKETTFINNNKKKWNRFEQARNGGNAARPEEIGELFTEVNDDLSYSQTFYGKRTVRAYLNQLAQGVHTSLYKQKGESLKIFWKAWTTHIPLEIYKSRKNLLFALVVFLIWTAIGAITTHYDPEFIELAAGKGMIWRSEHFIAQNDPLGFYGDSSQTSMFFQITFNNIGVALKCFFGGILFSLGTHVFLFQNSIMLGAFQYYYKLRGLLLTSFLTIWIHGAFEISAIVIASGAGFTLGHSILFPGSYSRIQSFQIGAKRGIRIMLSLIPVFIVAGFLESFVTRNYQTLPDWSKWLIIIFSFTIIAIYYIVYPIIVARKHPELLKQEEVISFVPKQSFVLNKIRAGSNIIAETFRFYRSFFKKIFRVIFTLAFPIVLLICVFQFYNHIPELNDEYYIDWAEQFTFMFGNPLSERFYIYDWIAVVAWLIPLSIMASAVFFAFKTMGEKFAWSSYFTYLKKQGAKIIFGVFVVYFFFVFLPFYLQIPFLLLLPFFLVIPSAMGIQENSFAFGRGFKFGAKQWSSGLGITIFFVFAIAVFAQPFAFVFSFHDYKGNPEVRDFLDMTTDFVKRIAENETSYGVLISNGIRQFVYILFFLFTIPLLFIASSFLFYSAREEIEVKGLKDEFEKFGKRSRTQETALDFE